MLRITTGSILLRSSVWVDDKVNEQLAARNGLPSLVQRYGLRSMALAQQPRQLAPVFRVAGEAVVAGARQDDNLVAGFEQGLQP